MSNFLVTNLYVTKKLHKFFTYKITNVFFAKFFSHTFAFRFFQTDKPICKTKITHFTMKKSSLH